jgi:hypothetical protein
MALLTFTWNPPRKQLRWFGCLWLPLALAALAVSVKARPGQIALGALAALSLVAGAAAPRFLRPVFVGLLIVTWPIGFVVSHVILAALFFAVLTPTAWVRRAFGRDTLRAGFDRQAASYWWPRQGRPPLSRYFDQS